MAGHSLIAIIRVIVVIALTTVDEKQRTDLVIVAESAVIF